MATVATMPAAASKKRTAPDAPQFPCAKKAAKVDVGPYTGSVSAGTAAVPPGAGLITPNALSSAGWSYPSLPVGMPYCFPFFNPLMFPPPFMAMNMAACMMASAAAAPAAAALQHNQQYQQPSTNNNSSSSMATHQAPPLTMPGACMAGMPFAAGYGFPGAGLMQAQVPGAFPPYMSSMAAASMLPASSFPGPAPAVVPPSCGMSLPAVPSSSGISCGASTATASTCIAAAAASPPPMAHSPGSVCNGSSDFPANGSGNGSGGAVDAEFASFIDSFLTAGDLADVSLAGEHAAVSSVLDELDVFAGLPGGEAGHGLARSDSLMSLLGTELGL